MSALVEKIANINDACRNRTMTLLSYLRQYENNNHVLLVDDEQLSLFEKMTEIGQRFSTLATALENEMREAAVKNYTFVMTNTAVEVLATIMDFVGTENVVIRKLTDVPVEARHLFIQLGDQIIEMIADTVKEHG